MHLRAMAATLALALASAKPLMAACDAELIDKFRTVLNDQSVSTVAEAVRQKACRTNSSSQSSNLDIPTKFGNVGFGQSGKSLTQACLENDRSYFERNELDLSYSFLPTESIEALSRFCFGGLQVTYTQTGQLVVFTAKYRDPSNGLPRAAKVRQLEISPPQALKCGKGLQPNEAIRVGGSDMQCTRQGDVNVMVTFRTDLEADKSIVLPKSTVVPLLWQRHLGSENSHHDWGCELNGTRYAAVDCHQDGVCCRLDSMIGLCRARFGQGVRIIPGNENPVVLRSRWEAPLSGNSYDCMRGGSVVGTYNCKEQKIQGKCKGDTCASEQARIGFCAFVHGDDLSVFDNPTAGPMP